LTGHKKHKRRKKLKGRQTFVLSVVIAQGEVHHWADHNLAVERDRTFVYGVKSEDRALGGVEDRGGEHRAEDAAVGDGEYAAFEVGERDLAFAGLLGDLRDAFFYFGHAEQVALADDGNHEAFVGRDRHADVEIMILNDLVAVDLGVDGRDFLERVDDSLGEKRHEAEFHAVLFHEIILVFRAQGHHGGHIALVEGREHGRFLLGADEPAGDGLPEFRHLGPRLAR